MKVEITIDCENAAFEDDPGHEVCRILHKLEASIGKYGLTGTSEKLFDINGNTTGKFLFWED